MIQQFLTGNVDQTSIHSKEKGMSSSLFVTGWACLGLPVSEREFDMRGLALKRSEMLYKFSNKQCKSDWNGNKVKNFTRTNKESGFLLCDLPLVFCLWSYFSPLLHYQGESSHWYAGKAQYAYSQSRNFIQFTWIDLKAGVNNSVRMKYFILLTILTFCEVSTHTFDLFIYCRTDSEIASS